MKFIKSIKNNKFVLNSSNYLIADFFNNAIAFLTIPIFTRILTPSDYGLVSVFNSYVRIFSIVLGFNIHGAIFRRFFEKEGEYPSFIGSNLIFLIIIDGFILFIFFLNRSIISRLLSISENIFIFSICLSILTIFYQMYLSLLQAHQNSRKYAILSVFRNSVITILSVLWVYSLSDEKYNGKIYSQLVISVLLSIYSVICLLKESKISFRWKDINYSLSYGIPLIPHALSGFILAQFDRIIINQLVGTNETGLYSFAYNVGMIMNIVVMALNKAWIPIFYKKLEKNRYDEIQNIAEKYAKIIFFIALLIILFSKELIIIMADKKYLEALDIVPYIVLGYVIVFLYTLFGNYAFYNKKTGTISIFTLLAGVINIVLNYLLIPRYGYQIAAVTTIISYFFLFVFHFVNSKFILKFKTIRINKIIFFLLTLCGGVSIFFSLPNNIYYLSLSFKIILLITIGLIFFYNEIIKLKKRI